MSDHPSNVAPSAFLTLSVLYSSQRPRGLISSHSHVQGSDPLRGFSLRTATLPHRQEHAPLSLKSCSLTSRSQMPQTKPRNFEAFIRTKMRSSSLVLPAPAAAPLFRFMPLQAFKLRQWLRLTQNQPLMTLSILPPSKLALQRSRPRLVYSVLSPAFQTLLSPEKSARSSFRASPHQLRKASLR